MSDPLEPCDTCARWDADVETCAELCKHNPALEDCYTPDGLDYVLEPEPELDLWDPFLEDQVTH